MKLASKTNWALGYHVLEAQWPMCLIVWGGGGIVCMDVPQEGPAPSSLLVNRYANECIIPVKSQLIYIDPYYHLYIKFHNSVLMFNK